MATFIRLLTFLRPYRVGVWLSGLLAAAARPEAIATALDAAGVGRLSAASTTAPLDLDRIERLRAAAKVVPRAIGS